MREEEKEKREMLRMRGLTDKRGKNKKENEEERKKEGRESA